MLGTKSSSLCFDSFARFAFVAAVAISLASVSACSGGRGPSHSLPKYDFNIDGRCFGGSPVTFSSVPSIQGGNKEVYRLRHPQVSGDYAAQLAQQLGIHSAPVFIPGSANNFVHVSGRWEAEDSTATLVVYEDYGIHFQSKVPAANGVALPEERAVETARSFLENARLLPKTELISTYQADATTGTVEVRFQARGVDLGMPPGDDQTISVTAAPDGMVIILTYYWQEPESLGSFPVISEAEARQRLANCDAFVFLHGNTLNVEQSRLAYVGVPVQNPPFDYLVPAYVFTDPGSKDGDWPPAQFAVVPAISDDYLR